MSDHRRDGAADGTDDIDPHDAHTLEPPHDIGAVARFDQWVDERFDVLRGREPTDRILYAISELADFSVLWMLIGAARGVRSEHEAAKAIRLAGILAAESALVNGAVKSLFKRERPVYQGERPHHLRIPLTTSFPSGHASAAVVAAMVLSEDSSWTPLWWGLAATVAASRVHVRIHHASDVIGGALTGAVIGTVARRLWKLPTR